MMKSERELAEQAASMAQVHVESSKQILQLDFDYSPESLQLVDFVISRFHPNGAALESTSVCYGAYIGEVIRRKLGGEWRQNEEFGMALSNVGGRVTVVPFNWARKRLENGEEDSIAFKYLAVLEAIGRKDLTPPQIELPSLDDDPYESVDDDEDHEESESEPLFEDDVLLQSAPMLVLMMVATVDAKDQQQTMIRFQRLAAQESENYSSELFRDCLQNTLQSIGPYTAMYAEHSPLLLVLQLPQLKEVLDREHPQQSLPFRRCLMTMAQQMAQPEKLFGMIPRRKSKARKGLLEMIETLLKLDE